MLRAARALLRRKQTSLRSDILQLADLSINTANHTAARNGNDIPLTAKEYALLEFFMLRAGQLLGREAIAEHVWDENFDPASNVIDVYVRRLRRKIDDGFAPALIHTRRGEGYLFSAQSEDDDVQ